MTNKQTKRHFFAGVIVKLLCLIAIAGFTAACGKAIVTTDVPGPSFSPGVITYDDKKSIKKKCDYIKKKKPGGVMFWELHGDYRNKLVKTIYKSLMGKM